MDLLLGLIEAVVACVFIIALAVGIGKLAGKLSKHDPR